MNLFDLVLVGKSIRMRGRPKCTISCLLLLLLLLRRASNWVGIEFVNVMSASGYFIANE